jgi:tetratricopeptide (TPR) repeat protein
MKILTFPQIAALALSLVLLLPGLPFAEGGGGSRTPTGDPAFAQANMAIQAQNWERAVELLEKIVARDGTNADAYNLLGFSERKRGNLDAAFGHYDRALVLDPKHRGAHEYLGEAFLLIDNLPKAEEHLARLDKLCFFPCEEYTDLKKAITAYKHKHGQ